MPSGQDGSTKHVDLWLEAGPAAAACRACRISPAQVQLWKSVLVGPNQEAVPSCGDSRQWSNVWELKDFSEICLSIEELS